MKLTDNSNAEVINLPNDLLWEDEFSWSPVVQSINYSLTGALLIDTEVKQAGRPISLKYPSNDMAWVTRDVAVKLLEWAAVPDKVMTLQFEYASDVRTFQVRFRIADTAVDAEPVKEFPEHDPDSWFRIKINLIEVA